MTTLTRILVPLVLIVVSSSAVAKSARKPLRELRREARAVEREYRELELLVRRDVKGGPTGTHHSAVTETDDGQRYAHADGDVVFERLSSTVIERIRVRSTSKILLELRPVLGPWRARWLPRPTYSGPWRSLDDEAASPTRERWALVVLNPEDAGGLRAALESVVYLDGELPSAEEVETCLARYPDHDEKLSRQRCNVPLIEGEREPRRNTNDR